MARKKTAAPAKREVGDYIHVTRGYRVYRGGVNGPRRLIHPGAYKVPDHIDAGLAAEIVEDGAGRFSDTPEFSAAESAPAMDAKPRTKGPAPENKTFTVTDESKTADVTSEDSE